MLQHTDVWRAIDRLAAKYGMSPSGLAKRSGLDPTTFNKSKRIGKDGKLRWPSTESLSKILGATGASIQEFMALVAGESTADTTAGIPRIGYQVLTEPGFFDEAGRPVGNGWTKIETPQLRDASAYAIEVRGQALLPVYADGDVLIVSPQAKAAPGHRVIVKTRDGGVVVGTLKRRSETDIELMPLQVDALPQLIGLDQVVWISRVLWSLH